MLWSAIFLLLSLKAHVECSSLALSTRKNVKGHTGVGHAEELMRRCPVIVGFEHYFAADRPS